MNKAIEIVIFGGTDRETKSKNKKFFSKSKSQISNKGILSIANRLNCLFTCKYFRQSLAQNCLKIACHIIPKKFYM